MLLTLAVGAALTHCGSGFSREFFGAKAPSYIGRSALRWNAWLSP